MDGLREPNASHNREVHLTRELLKTVQLSHLVVLFDLESWTTSHDHLAANNGDRKTVRAHVQHCMTSNETGDNTNPKGGTLHNHKIAKTNARPSAKLSTRCIVS